MLLLAHVLLLLKEMCRIPLAGLHCSFSEMHFLLMRNTLNYRNNVCLLSELYKAASCLGNLCRSLFQVRLLLLLNIDMQLKLLFALELQHTFQVQCHLNYYFLSAAYGHFASI